TERVEAYELLEERVRERTRELSTLLEVAHKVASTLDLDTLLGVILDQIRRVVDFTGGSILVVEGDELSTAAYRGPMPQEQALCLRFSLLRAGVNWETVEKQQPVIIDDVYGAGAAARAFREMVGEHLHGGLDYIRSHLGIPLILKDQVIGQLTISHSEPNHYTQRHADLVTTIASQAAFAIENAQLYKRAGELAALEERGRLARELLEKDRLEGELEVAHRIQRALLPRELPEMQGWQLATYYRSARAVGGDFYDFYNLPDGRSVVVLPRTSADASE
ncbi:MAG: GAF domain-containing protein, partial [Chloroflexota bacterium]|nr:GAF domain-containing protein [Chloroflexota bacterium]